MPDYTTLSVEQKLDFLSRWYNECGGGSQIEQFKRMFCELVHRSHDEAELSRFTSAIQLSATPTLFECRLKIMRDWFVTWNYADRDRFAAHMLSVDGSLRVTNGFNSEESLSQFDVKSQSPEDVIASLNLSENYENRASPVSSVSVSYAETDGTDF